MAVIHPRTSWQDPNLPVWGPTRLQWPNITVEAIHYTAADNLIDGDPGERASDLPAYLRAIQRDYVYNRGYSIGYNWAIDWLGGIWELRGWDFMCAANKDHNTYTYAVLMLVDGADPATAEAMDSARGLIRMAEWYAHRHISPLGHKHLPSATACPGFGLSLQVTGGLFEAAYFPPEPLPPVPPNPLPIIPPGQLIPAHAAGALTGDVMHRFVKDATKPNDQTRWVLVNDIIRVKPTFESANKLIRDKKVSNTLDTAEGLTPEELAGFPLVNA